MAMKNIVGAKYYKNHITMLCDDGTRIKLYKNQIMSFYQDGLWVRIKTIDGKLKSVHFKSENGLKRFMENLEE